METKKMRSIVVVIQKEEIMETKKMRTIVVVTMLLCFGMVTALVIPSSAMAKESTVKIGLVMEPWPKKVP
jgi:hypothetical protein